MGDVAGPIRRACSRLLSRSASADRPRIGISFNVRRYETGVVRSGAGRGDKILSLAEGLADHGGRGTNCALPLRVAYSAYHCSRFEGVVLVSDHESWIGTGGHSSTGRMTEWQTFVPNPVRRHHHGWVGRKLICIDFRRTPRPRAGTEQTS